MLLLHHLGKHFWLRELKEKAVRILALPCLDNQPVWASFRGKCEQELERGSQECMNGLLSAPTEPCNPIRTQPTAYPNPYKFVTSDFL